MMIVAIMLTYTVSFELQLPAYVTIRNQCSNIELGSPVYFSNGIVCPRLSDQQINIRVKMSACFKINATQDEFEGVLLFKLRRYSSSQHNTDTSTTETTESETTHIYMLVAWKVKKVQIFRIYSIGRACKRIYLE
jgi:hypothetical protein